MMAFIITIHVIVCALLIVLILIQRGRGGGLVDSFSDVESMLGTKTNAFLTRSTTILSVLFFITCLSLAVLSVRQSRSLLRDVKASEAATAAQTKAEVTPLVQPTALPKDTSTQAPKPEDKAAAKNAQEAEAASKSVTAAAEAPKAK